MKQSKEQDRQGHDPVYRLLDSGGGRKLEQWGPWVLSRPCAAALWAPRLAAAVWQRADAVFDRDGGNRWTMNTALPDSWCVSLAGLRFKVSPTGFGHVGLFPEHQWIWNWMERQAARRGSGLHFLNLFAYTGGATLAMARAGARVCHLDASKGMVQRARENAALNGMDQAPVRWMVEDVRKFLHREIRRGVVYDAILMDPPSFGRGQAGEVFKIEEHLVELLDLCERLLSARPAFMVLTCHTPALTSGVLSNLLAGMAPARGSAPECGELVMEGPQGGVALPSGSYATVDFGKRGGS